MALTKAAAEAVAARERARGEYGELTVRDCGEYGHIVTGRKVVNGQGIGRTWTDTGEDDWRPSGAYLAQGAAGR